MESVAAREQGKEAAKEKNSRDVLETQAVSVSVSRIILIPPGPTHLV